jgi:hypothetical protein
LYADREFCEAIGRATLAAGRLESTLKAFLRMKGVAVPDGRATFGWLIGALQKHRFLSNNGVQVLRDLKRQRNYLTHSLFDLFAGRVPETILPGTELVPMDVDVFTEKARVLGDNMFGLSRIAERRLDELMSQPTYPPESGDPLFRP